MNICTIAKGNLFTTRSINALQQNVLQPYGLRSIHWLVLGTISEAADGIRVTELARDFEVKTTYITAVLNRLRASKYIDIKLLSLDGRVRLSTITEEGLRQLSIMNNEMSRAMEKLGEAKVSK